MATTISLPGLWVAPQWLQGEVWGGVGVLRGLSLADLGMALLLTSSQVMAEHQAGSMAEMHKPNSLVKACLLCCPALFQRGRAGGCL